MTLSDGYVANLICFWETATLKDLYKNKQEPNNFYCRNEQFYSSQLTQPSYISHCCSQQNKIDNWKFLNKNVFKKIHIELEDDTIYGLVKINKVVIAQFYTLLRYKIQKYKDSQTQYSHLLLAKQQQQLSLALSRVEAERRGEQTDTCPRCALYQEQVKLLKQEIQLLKEQMQQQ